VEALDSGDRQLKSGQYQQAILFFDQALSFRPDYPEAYQLRGRASVAMAKPKDAIPDFFPLHRVCARRTRSATSIAAGPTWGVRISRQRSKMECRRFQKGPKVATAYQLRGIALRRVGKTCRSAGRLQQKPFLLTPENGQLL